MRTIVYADGGCDPNPGPGGWGVVIRTTEGPVELHGGELVTTNNRMELTAAISALEYFPEGTAVEMRCDSQYVVKSITEWIPGWKRRGWRTASGPVKNVDLMERLDALAGSRDVRWTWVRGHSGEAGNERADRLAALGRRVALGLPATEDEAPAEKRPAAAATVSMKVDTELAAWVAQAAERAGLPTEAFVAEALRLALELGPERVARIRKDVALESAAPPPGQLF